MKTILALITLASLTSCAGIMSGVSGQPVPSVSVSRIQLGHGTLPIPTPIFQLAAADVFQAEANPETVWGLYDAGRVAEWTSQSVDLGKFYSSK